MEQDIINDYQQRALLAQQEADKYKKLVNTYSFLRLSIFILLAVAIYIGAVNDTFTIVAIALVVLIFFFAWLVSKQARFERMMKYFLNLKPSRSNHMLYNVPNKKEKSFSIYRERQHFKVDIHISVYIRMYNSNNNQTHM